MKTWRGLGRSGTSRRRYRSRGRLASAPGFVGSTLNPMGDSGAPRCAQQLPVVLLTAAARGSSVSRRGPPQRLGRQRRKKAIARIDRALLPGAALMRRASCGRRCRHASTRRIGGYVQKTPGASLQAVTGHGRSARVKAPGPCLHPIFDRGYGAGCGFRLRIRRHGNGRGSSSQAKKTNQLQTTVRPVRRRAAQIPLP